MVKVDNMTHKALNSYFNHLATFGYKSHNDVEKLLVLTHIRELLDSPFDYYITEEDLNTIIQALYCLMQSTCFLPFTELSKGASLNTDLRSGDVRLSENDIIRFSENTLVRFTNK